MELSEYNIIFSVHVDAVTCTSDKSINSLSLLRIPAHRCVLYAASDYFKALFTANKKEKNTRKVDLKGISGSTLAQLIDYCYTQKIIIDESNVEETFLVAHLFGLVELIGVCELMFIKMIAVSNVFDFLGMADAYKLAKLRMAVNEFIQNQFINIIDGEPFLSLTADRLVQLFSDNATAVGRSEQAVFNAAMNWVKYDLNDRRQYLSQLIDKLDMTKIDYKVSF